MKRAILSTLVEVNWLNDRWEVVYRLFLSIFIYNFLENSKHYYYFLKSRLT